MSCCGFTVSSPCLSGSDCSVSVNELLWERVATAGAPSGRASHVAVMEGDTMWAVGGFSLAQPSLNKALYK
jgi:hypothetical protein